MTPALLLLAATVAAPATVADLKLPPGFSAKLYADNPIAPDIYTMTIDDAGRVLIAGRGYVRVLVDDDNDGYADRAVDLIDGLKEGPLGLLAEGDSLFVVSDGGLKRYRGYNGKDKLKGPPEFILALTTGGEHAAHAVRRGPDGWLYLLCGNNAGVRKTIITDQRSPVKDPVAGALLRISPSFKSVEVVADGFRNPYSFDFNTDGEPFTYDSDNERCVGLPWYEGCRFYHVVPSGNYGWRSPQLSQTWRKPTYFPDVVPPIADLGRGSPTGVACYRHSQFPANYRGGFFLADWTFGRIHHVPLKASGSTYEGKPEVFAEAIGTSGFAPTALAVHPKTGELFVSIGGRGARGGVYRIAFDKGIANPKPLPMARRSLDYDKDTATQWLKDCQKPWTFQKWPRPAEQRAQRHALELMLRHHEKMGWTQPLLDAVKFSTTVPEPLVSAAGARAAGGLVVPVGNAPRNGPPTAAQLAVAIQVAPNEPEWALEAAFGVLADRNATTRELLTAFRIVHLAHGDLTAKRAVGTVFEGYTLRDPIPLHQAERLRTSLGALSRQRAGPATEPEVVLELARLFGILGGDYDAPVRLTTLSRIDANTAQADDLHFLISLAGTRNTTHTLATKALANAMFAIPQKVKTQGVVLDRHWPLRFEEMLAQFGKNWPALADVVFAHADFGQPEHVAFIKPLKIPRDKAARTFLAVAATSPNFTWTPDFVELLGELPPDVSRPVLNRLWKQPGLQEAVTGVVIKSPTLDDSDEDKLLAGLSSLDSEIVRLAARALGTIPTTNANRQVGLAVTALRRLAPEDKAARVTIVSLLQTRTGVKIEGDAKAWAEWVTKNQQAALPWLKTSDSFDALAWQNRAAGINWAKGDATRGKVAFTKATCAACHDSGGAVGPSLVGVAKRFSLADLLTAIVQPSKDVPARYRPTRVTTTDEKSYLGVLVYEATDGVILQTGADTTVRVAGANIAAKKVVDVSLMPTGLIDKLSDQEIADMLAYLGTLK